MEGKGRGLNWGTIPEFSWSDRQKPGKPLVSRVSGRNPNWPLGKFESEIVLLGPACSRKHATTLNKMCNQNLTFTKSVRSVVFWYVVQLILFLSVLHKNMRPLLDAERLLIKEIRRCHPFPSVRVAAWPASTIQVSICLLLYCNRQPLDSRLGGARSRSQRCGEELLAPVPLPEM